MTNAKAPRADIAAAPPIVRGPGSRRQAGALARSISHGIADAAAQLVTKRGVTTSVHLDQIHIRLRAGASDHEIARALDRAIARARHAGRPER